MEDRPGQTLAAHLKSALDARSEGEDKTARREAAAEARRARVALLSDLASFARSVGHLEVREGPRGLHLRYRARGLFFEPIGEEDVVRVRGTSLMAGVHRLIRQEGTGQWMFGTFDRSKRERYRPLFDEGLAELLQRGLHLPEPPLDEPERPPRNYVLSPVRPGA